jgi:hypothetical protein
MNPTHTEEKGKCNHVSMGDQTILHEMIIGWSLKNKEGNQKKLSWSYMKIKIQLIRTFGTQQRQC